MVKQSTKRDRAAITGTLVLSKSRPALHLAIMTESRRAGTVVAGVMAVAAVAFLLGISWGLPTSAVNEYLFGSEPVWSGEQIYFLSGGMGMGKSLGADVDLNPIAETNQPVLLNGSDQQRAEIVRRYRLYSYQPDEMITLRALAQMRPGEGMWDPRLYQYGGLWIYPVGAMLKIAQIVHFIPAPPADTTPLVYYLQNPNAFGRFYIVMRLYAALWGVLGAWAIFWIARRLTKDLLVAAAAALAFIFLPVVMNGAHEAKPHLPGAVLILLAVSAAIKYVETGKHLWWIAAGALCGAAAGMVLSAVPIFLMIPVMTALRRCEKPAERIGTALVAVLVGVVVYFITNPYVGINLLNPHGEGGMALRSNMANTKAMYSISPRGFADGIKLLGLGTSPLLAMLGIAGAIVVALVHRARTKAQSTEPQSEPIEKPATSPAAAPPAPSLYGPRPSIVATASPSAIAWLLFVPAAAVLLQFLLTAAGKPAEYARFGILPAIALLLLAAWAASLVSTGNTLFRQLLPALLVVSALPYGLAYLRAFIRDTRQESSRIQSADELPPTGRVLLTREPAPYNMPPVNLFRRDLVLVPPGSHITPGSGDILIYPVDVPISNTPDGPRRLPFKEAPGSLDQFTTPITWANKTFAVEGMGAAPVE